MLATTHPAAVQSEPWQRPHTQVAEIHGPDIPVTFRVMWPPPKRFAWQWNPAIDGHILTRYTHEMKAAVLGCQSEGVVQPMCPSTQQEGHRSPLCTRAASSQNRPLQRT